MEGELKPAPRAADAEGRKEAAAQPAAALGRFFELSQDLLGVADFTGRLLHVNPAWGNNLGWSSAELKARPFLEWVHAEERLATARELKKAEGGQAARFESRCLGREGAGHWVEWSATADPGRALVYLSGRPAPPRPPAAGWQQQHTESERRVRAGAVELRKTGLDTGEQFRLLVESVQDYAIIMLDLEGRAVSWNRGAERLTGYAAAEFLGQPSARLHPEEALRQGMPERELREVAEKGRCEEEGWRRRREGSRFWAITTLTAVRDDAGQLRGFALVMRDVTERKRAEEALRESLLFRCQGERIGRIGAWKVNPVTDSLYWTEGIYDILELPLDYQPGFKEDLRWYDASSIPVLKEAMARAMEDGESFVLEAGVTTRTGQHLWAEVRCLGRVVEGGGTFIVGTFQDITARKQAVQAIQQNELRMRSLLASMNDLVFVLDRDLVFQEYQQPVKGELFIPPGEFVGKRFDDIAFPEPARAIIKRALRETLDTQCPARAEYPLDMPDGRRWFDLHVTSFESGGGGQQGLTCVVRDTTESKRTQEALRQQRDLGVQLLGVSSLAEGLGLCVRAAQGITGLEGGSLFLADATGALKLVFQEGWPPRHLEAHKELAADSPLAQWAREGAAHHGGPPACGLPPGLEGAAGDYRSFSLVPIRREGRLLALLLLASRSAQELSSSITHLLESIAQQVGIFIDQVEAQAALRQAHDELEQRVARRTAELSREIQERKAVEVEVGRAKAAADAANQAKSRFLANMSHEIRTPLHAILGFSQLLQRDAKVAPEQRKHLEIINRSGEHLLRLIGDVLDMSKIEAGRMQLALAECDFRALLEGMESMFQLRTQEKGLKFGMRCAPGLPERLHTDEGKIRQVLLNILSNAVKFTVHGHIQLRVASEVLAEGEGSNQMAARVAVEVEDTGPGIAPADLERIFEPFEQIQGGQRLVEGGTGLGLPISRQLARMLGGEVAATSQVGVGSTLRFSFTAAILAPATPAAPATPGQRILRLKATETAPLVCVVDDIWSNRSLLRALLSRAGFRVCEAATGLEAVERFAETRPDLVLMDLRMPGQDGFTATQAIRAAPGGGDTRILLVSGDLLGNTEAQWRGAGADGFIPKPFHQDQLLEQIGLLLGIEYVYEGTVIPQISQTGLGKEAIYFLAPELRDRIREATEAGDRRQLMEIITREVAPVHEALGAALSRMAANYDYHSILRLLNEEGNP